MTGELLEVRELARAHTADVIDRLARIVSGSKNEMAAVAAGRELLDRGHGKASQTITADVTFSNMSDEQLEARKREIVARAVAEQAAGE